ncbi:histone H1.3-like [Xiphophorus maculatus]|uniref:histone H1.3-like n=1 Tax=Xiphophorus maculatus TaxID=8083 RepID=UPI0003B5BEA7|nr:histone H1.3-like [Xiphophorus maculatus]
MKKKNGAKKALQGGVKENASISLKTKEKKLLGVSKQQNNPSKNPAGRGLGKAGAKRLGRLLKRVVQPQEEPAAVAALPKTPVRLFKHQIEKKADNAPAAKFSKQQVSKLILNVVSQCKHKGGISMDELKETLAAEGYDVAKNNRQVKVVTEQLLNNKTLVRTTRNTSLRLNNKKVIKTKSAKMNKATSQKPPQELWKKTPAKRNPEEETKAQKNNKNLAKAKAKIQKMQRNTDKAAPKSKKQKKQSPKPKRKPQKRARKRPQLRKNRCMRAQTPPAKTTKTHRHQPKQVKSSRRKQPQRRKLPKRSSKRQKKHRKSYRRS